MFSLNNKIAYDLGTSKSIIASNPRGIVYSEPTVISYGKDKKDIIGFGESALSMIGKVPGDIISKRPLKQGVIAYYKLTETYIKKSLEKAFGRSVSFKSEIMVSLPSGITSVEERALLDVFKSAGASRVYLLPMSIAAALGVDLPIYSTEGNMVVNVGAGISEIAILSMNGIVVSKTRKIGGDSINDEIIELLKKRYNILIGEQMAEKLKISIGSLNENKKKMEIRGRDPNEGLPKTIEIESRMVTPAIAKVTKDIVYSIKEVLEQTPPELSSDIVDNGILLTGGLARLEGFSKLITRAIGVPVFVPEEPEKAVIKGLLLALKNLDEVKRSLKS